MVYFCAKEIKKVGYCLLNPKKISTFAPLKRRENRDEFGRMAEWSNAAVLKTVDLHGSGGSNPSSSARIGSFLRSDFFLHIVYTPGPARPTDLFLVYSVNTLTPFAMARVQGFESLFFREKRKAPIGAFPFSISLFYLEMLIL